MLAVVVNKRSFIVGFFSGIGLALCTTLLVMIFLTSRGVTVSVNAPQLATLVRERVEAEAKQELPRMAQGIVDKIPSAVHRELHTSKGISLKLLDLELSLPPKTVRQINKQVEKKLTDVLIGVVKNYDTRPLANSLGVASYRLVRQNLEKELSGMRIPVQIYPWLTVPVTVDGK